MYVSIACYFIVVEATRERAEVTCLPPWQGCDVGCHEVRFLLENGIWG